MVVKAIKLQQFGTAQQETVLNLDSIVGYKLTSTPRPCVKLIFQSGVQSLDYEATDEVMSVLKQKFRTE